MLSSNQRGRLVFIQLVLKVIQGPLYDIENTDEIFIFKIHSFFIFPLFLPYSPQKSPGHTGANKGPEYQNNEHWTEYFTCSVYLNTNFPYHIAMLKEPMPLVGITNLI